VDFSNLSLHEIELLVSSEKSGGPKYLDSTGWHDGKPSSLMSGSFTGRAGSIGRSNKGRTYRKPNGSRRYLVDYESDVIAYMP